jgi:hypothetical protein
MAKENKITQEELDKLRSLNQTYRDLKFQIADIEVSFERMKSQKMSSLANLETSAFDLSQFQDELISKYGDIKINLQTGEYN